VAAGVSTEQFIEALGRRRATGEVAKRAELVEACLAQLGEWGAQRVLIPNEPELDEFNLAAQLAGTHYEVLTWPTGHGWRDLLGLDDAPPTCAITVPRLGVAERGTVVIEASTTHGRSLDAIGWWHLSILFEERIRPTLAAALNETYSGRTPPSAASLVSGPSRSSDVEKITTYGAHGALAEHVIVVR
jgi:L-lactate dehydrogenase complex protein LldG